jgi:hypothetical protein
VKYSRDAAENKVLGPPLVLVPGGIAGKLKSIPMVDNGEVAAVAGVGAGVIGGDDDGNDDDNDNDDDDEDDDNEDEKKPSGGGIRLVPRAERRRDHRGMASVTTIISGSRKRKATDDSSLKRLG